MTGQPFPRKRYEIVVRGRLSERYWTAFADVTLEPRPGETTLLGEFTDQAQLYGLLNRLRDFGVELISINAESREPGGRHRRLANAQAHDAS